MKISEQLTEKIKKDLGVDIINIRRLRPGKWQRAAGAWAWTASVMDQTGRAEYEVGSCRSMKGLLAKGGLFFCGYGVAGIGNEIEIDPDDIPKI